jgi:hypothetical protein
MVGVVEDDAAAVEWVVGDMGSIGRVAVYQHQQQPSLATFQEDEAWAGRCEVACVKMKAS